jgi:O-antigen/teichoic acid export membrane protein
MTSPSEPASLGGVPPPEPARSSRRDTVALATGSLANGVLAYVFFAMATRSLGASTAAPVTVLWTYWSLAAAALTFPLQHWIARTVAADAAEGFVHRTRMRVAAAVAGASVVLAGAAWLLREQLFHRSDAWFPLLVGAVTIGAAVVGYVRGVLTARNRFTQLAIAVALENGVRCVAAGALIASGDESAVGFGVVLAASSFSVLLWVSTLRLDPALPETTDGQHSPLAFLSTASAGQLLGQAVLTSSPVVLTLSGGSAAQVTALFATLALFRAPYTLGLGVVAQLTGRLTRLVVEGDLSALRTFRRGVVAGTVVTTAVAAVLGATIGPWLVRVIFGPGVALGHGVTSIVAAGSALAISGLVVTVALLAHGRPSAVLVSWTAAVTAGAAAFVVVHLGADPLAATAWSFLVAETAACLLLVTAEGRSAQAGT